MAKILIVDDDTSVVRSLERLVRSLGYKYETCESGPDALNLLSKGGFDVVISDFNMLGMNGLELLNHIRKDEPKSNIPFIVLTAKAEEETIIRLTNAGAYTVIIKPVEDETLNEFIKGALGNV